LQVQVADVDWIKIVSGDQISLMVRFMVSGWHTNTHTHTQVLF
jgi:hypothetical protein